MEQSNTTALGRTESLANKLVLEWQNWWNGLTFFQKIKPLALILLYWAVLLSIGGFRGDHLFFGLGIIVLNYTGPRVKKVYTFFLPILLVGIVYDSQRFYSDYIRGPVHVSEPYLFDKTFFGITTAQGILTPNEWWQLHTHPILDFITGFFYLCFIAMYAVLSAYMFFWVGKKGTAKLSAETIAAQAPRMMWAFFWLNLIGFSTYYWYAAAPPWYVAQYGLGPVHMEAVASAAGCIRFDQLLGTHFFTEMYGRSADVFGAIPSLHVAYPLLAVYYAFRFGGARVVALIYYVVMCFSAVYLNHHYVLDIICGSIYAIVVAVATDAFYNWREKSNPVATPSHVQ